jgi:hypothetical protein
MFANNPNQMGLTLTTEFLAVVFGDVSHIAPPDDLDLAGRRMVIEPRLGRTPPIDGRAIHDFA